MTSTALIRTWLEEARKMSATHLIVVCDEDEDEEDYPVYVAKDQKVKKVCENYPDRVMEVYKVSGDWEKQLDQERALNY